MWNKQQPPLIFTSAIYTSPPLTDRISLETLLKSLVPESSSSSSSSWHLPLGSLSSSRCVEFVGFFFAEAHYVNGADHSSKLMFLQRDPFFFSTLKNLLMTTRCRCQEMRVVFKRNDLCDLAYTNNIAYNRIKWLFSSSSSSYRSLSHIRREFKVRASLHIQ